jgi:hypothetical protein
MEDLGSRSSTFFPYTRRREIVLSFVMQASLQKCSGACFLYSENKRTFTFAHDV